MDNYVIFVTVVRCMLNMCKKRYDFVGGSDTLDTFRCRVKSMALDPLGVLIVTFMRCIFCLICVKKPYEFRIKFYDITKSSILKKSDCKQGWTPPYEILSQSDLPLNDQTSRNKYKITEPNNTFN